MSIPQPDYEYDINRLTREYRKAIEAILRELERLDVSDMSRANSMAALAHIAEILKELDDTAIGWVDEVIPKAALDGVAATILSLGALETLEEAETLAKFNRMNKDMVSAIVADTQSDLLAVSKNIDNKVRSTIRQVAAESMRANFAKGINGRRTINRDILTNLREKLGDSVNTGIIDARGRRWKPEVYVDMLTRTKTMYAHIEATTNEAVGRGAFYGVISRHGAKDNCRLYEGKIVKLIPEASGDYPYIGDLRNGRDIFHPNCRHVVSPLRNPGNYEEV
jgi:hypothetical protein